MPFFWKERYSLGIEEIDRQHKKLFEIGNRAYELVMLNDEYDHFDEIMAILDEMIAYTQYHFEYEEELMQKYAYSEWMHQEAEHSFFAKRIKKFTGQRVDEDQQTAMMEIINFLSDWISTHILLSDRKYAEEFKQKGFFL